MMRTLVDEGLRDRATARAAERAGGRHSPASRFITLFYGLYEPATGRLEYVNAGHLPPLIRRADGTFERIVGDGKGGLALGMFDARDIRHPRDDDRERRRAGALQRRHHGGRRHRRACVRGQPALETVVNRDAANDPEAIGRALLAAAEKHAGDARLGDDLTALVLKRARRRCSDRNRPATHPESLDCPHASVLARGRVRGPARRA